MLRIYNNFPLSLGVGYSFLFAIVCSSSDGWIRSVVFGCPDVVRFLKTPHKSVD